MDDLSKGDSLRERLEQVAEHLEGRIEEIGEVSDAIEQRRRYRLQMQAEAVRAVTPPPPGSPSLASDEAVERVVKAAHAYFNGAGQLLDFHVAIRSVLDQAPQVNAARSALEALRAWQGEPTWDLGYETLNAISAAQNVFGIGESVEASK